MLSLLIAIPVVAAVVILASPAKGGRTVAAIASLLSLVVASVVAFTGSVDATGIRWSETREWFPSLGMAWRLGVDGLGGLLVLLTAFLTTVATALSPRDGVNQKLYWSMLLLASGATIGAFVAADLLLFYIFFEACLIPVFVLMGVFGKGDRSRASLTFVVYTIAASLLLLAGIIGLRVHTGSFDLATVRDALKAGDVPPAIAALGLAGFTAAFAVKSPVFPFHSWLPAAYRCAPAGAVMLLSGAMAKLGTFGFMKFVLGMFPQASETLATPLVWLGIAGIVFGAVNAIVQRDLWLVVACSSVSHLGYVIAGMFSGNQVAMDGASLQMLNHGVTVGALFLALGCMENRWGTTRIDRLGGIWQTTPVLGRFLLIASLSSIALPLTNGFVGELMILLGLFQKFPIGAVVGTSGAILSAIYMLWALQRALFGPSVKPSVSDLRGGELIAMGILTLLIFAIGIAPSPLLKIVHPGTPSLASVGTTPGVTQ